MKPIKVLLADESAAVRLLLGALLADDDRFAVVGDVATGAEVMQRCREADLVVLDLVLADIDAFTLMEQLRAERSDLPIAVYAAVDPPYLRSEAAARGAVAYFSHATEPQVVLDGFAATVDAVRAR